MVGMEGGEVSLFNVFDTRADKLYGLERSAIGVSRRVDSSSNCHDVVLVIHVVMFEFDRVGVN